jgi:hypothetical protein
MTDTLADRMEGLTGPCRETDAEVWCLMRGAQLVNWDSLAGPVFRDRDGTILVAGRKIIPSYTASLEAVAALIGEKLPGWAWKVGTCCVSDDGWVVPDFNCPVHGERLRKQFGEFAAGSPEDTGIDIDRRPSGQPALALLEAFLRGYALHLATLRKLKDTP